MSLAIAGCGIRVHMEQSAKTQFLVTFFTTLVFAFLVSYVVRHSADNVIEEVETTSPALNLNLA